MRHRDGGTAREPQDVAERDRSGGRDVDRAAHRIPCRGLERPGGVVGMQELEARIEPELSRDEWQAEVADERHLESRPDLWLVAEHAADQVRVAPGEVVEVALELRGIALKTGAQGKPAGHLLREEPGRGPLASVDRGRAPNDHALERLGPLAGGKELKRPDDVDVVKDARGLARLRIPEDPAMNHRVGLGPRKEPGEQRAPDVRLDEV